MSKRILWKSICVCTLAILVAGNRSARAQQAVPLDPSSPHPNAGETLEVEQIEVRRLGAIPNEIHRKGGRFLLLVINRNPENPDATFIVEPSTIGDGKLGPSPLLRLGGPGVNDRKHRAASLFAAHSGEFDLKYADTGNIVCKIKID